MRRHFSILITAEQAMAESLETLSQWTGSGLVHPFIRADSCALTKCEGRLTGLLSDASGSREVDIFETLGKQPYETVRVVALAGPDLEDAQQLGETVERLHSEVEGLGPPEMRTMEVRMWHPLRQQMVGSETSSPKGLFSARADVNLVVIPEDRYGSDTLAAPVVRSDTEVYSEHVAVETATVLGLWLGMEESPVDDLERGVLGYGEAKLHLGRSFVRLAQIDSPRFPTTFNRGGRLPVPQDAVESPYPDAAVSELADRITNNLLTPLRFSPLPAEDKEGWRAAVVRLARGISVFFREMPGWLFDLSRDRVERRVAREMPDSPLQPFVIRVLREGADAAETFPKAEEVEGAAARQFHLAGGAKVDQRLWRDMGEAIMGAADAGDEPETIGVSRPQARRAVIVDLTALSPPLERYQEGDQQRDLGLVVEALRQDSQTLLGRINTALRQIVGDNRRSREDAAAKFDQVAANLGCRPPSDLGWVSMLFAGLGLLFIVGLLLATGLVEDVGIVNMTGAQRSLGWVVISSFLLVALVTVSAFGYHELRNKTDDADDEPTDLKRALKKVVLVAVGVVAATAIGSGVSRLIFPDDAPGLAAAVGVLALAVGLLWAVRSTFVFQKTLRRFALTTMVYVGAGIIGMLARQYGWYGEVAASDRLALLGIPTAALGILLLGLSIVAGWWVGREEHWIGIRLRTLHSMERDIVGAMHREREAEEASEQFIGSAVAWSEVLWRPFGPSEESNDRSLPARSYRVQKMTFNSYRVVEQVAEFVRGSWIRRLASPGWLSRQYEAAVRDFQQRFAGGSPAHYSETMRPDQDPRVVSNLEEEERSEVSLRWKFGSTLRSGIHDGVLEERLREHQDREEFEWILNESDKFIPTGPHDVSLREMLCSVLPTRNSEAHYAYFRQTALTDDLDRSWQPQAWLPLIDYPNPPGEVRIETTEIKELPDDSHLVSAFRYDLAGPFPLSSLLVGPAFTADSQLGADIESEPVL